MALRWFYNFDDRDGNSIAVEIDDSQYSGDPIETPLSYEDPYILQQRQVSRAELGLRVTEFSVNIEQASEDIYKIVRGADKGRFTFAVKKNNNTFYEGEVDSSTITKETEFRDRYVLEGRDLEPLKRKSSAVGATAKDTIANSLGSFADSLSTVVETAPEGAGSGDPLAEYGFADEAKVFADEVMNDFEFLQKLCKRFNWTITWAGEGEYIVEEWTEKSDQNKTKYTYDLPGATLSNTNTSYSQTETGYDIEPRRNHRSSEEASVVKTATDYRLSASPQGKSLIQNKELRSQFPQPWNGFSNDIVFLGEVLRMEDSVNAGDDVISQDFSVGRVPDGAVAKFNWKVLGGGGPNGSVGMSFSIARADGTYSLIEDRLPIAKAVSESGEQTVKFGLPNQGDSLVTGSYPEGAMILPKGAKLQYPWATVTLQEKLVAGEVVLPEAVCEVEERQVSDEEKQAYGLPDRTDTDPLIDSQQEARMLTWVPLAGQNAEYPSIARADYQKREAWFSFEAPDGVEVRGEMNVALLGHNLDQDVDYASFDIQPSATKSTYRTVRQEYDGILDFVYQEEEEDPNEIDRGDLPIGTTPKETRSTVFLSGGGFADDWGNGLLLEEKMSINVLNHTLRPTDEVNLGVRGKEWTPEKAVVVNGDVHIPVQVKINPTRKRYEGRFLKLDPFSGFDVSFDSTEEEEESGEDEVVNRETGTVVQPIIGPEQIEEYLRSEKENLTLAADLIEFNGASEFNEYLVSDDYDGDLPDSDGVIAGNGTTGFIIKDAYFDDQGNQTAPSEIIITNATIRDTLIEDGVDIGSGNFTGTDITLNSNFSGSSPTTDAFFGVERGTEPNALVEWDESSDQWKFGTEGNLTAPLTSGEDITITGNWTFASDVTLDGATIETSGAATGFSASGTVIDDTESWFDSLNVRNTFFASEFEIKKLRVSRGTQVFSVGGGKVESIPSQSSSSVTIEFEEPSGIESGDFCLIQEANPTDGTVAIETRLKATSTSGSQVTFDVLSDRAVEVGDDVVVVASSTASRDSFLAADPYEPAFDVLNGISNFSQYDSRTPTARLGNVGGVNGNNVNPSGSGLYSSNVYLEGSGEIAGNLLVQGSVTATEINTDSVLADDILANSASITNQLTMGTNGVITNADADYEITENGVQLEIRQDFTEEAALSFFDSSDSTEYGAMYGDRFTGVDGNQNRRINIDIKNGAAFRMTDTSTAGSDFFSASSGGSTFIGSDGDISMNAGTDLDIQVGDKVDIFGPLQTSSEIKSDTFLISGGYDQLTFPGLDNYEFSFIYQESSDELEIRAKDGNGNVKNALITLT